MTDLATMLGPCATVPPTHAATAAIRAALLPPKFRANYPKTGQQGFPRGQDGADVYSYAVHHKIITPEEATPAMLRWRDEENLNRGLGSGHPKAAMVWKDPYTGAAWLNQYGTSIPVTIRDGQHETMQQYLTNAVLMPDDQVCVRAPTDLRNEMLKDPLVATPQYTNGNSRYHGRMIKAFLQEGSPESLTAATTIMGKVYAQMGKKSGLNYYTLNLNAGDDHHDLPICPEQETTILGGFALAYKVWPIEAIRDAIYHGLDMCADVQMPNGSFANDAGWDEAGNVVFSDPNKTMDLWICADIILAKWALGPLWPGKAQAILDKARALWLATGYTKPGDVNFGPHNVLSITIQCAAEYGWKA